MEVLTLPMAKEQLRVTSTAEDNRIMRECERAEQLVFRYLGYDDLSAFYTAHGEVLPFALEAAMLLALQVLHDGKPEDTWKTPAVIDSLRVYRTRMTSATD